MRTLLLKRIKLAEKRRDVHNDTVANETDATRIHKS